MWEMRISNFCGKRLKRKKKKFEERVFFKPSGLKKKNVKVLLK